MNGCDVAERIREQRLEMPLILYTGFIDDMPAEKLKLFTGVVSKPNCVELLDLNSRHCPENQKEVFAVWRTGSGDRLPDITDVLSWLTYLDSQCPECTQIEWPTDD